MHAAGKSFIRAVLSGLRVDRLLQASKWSGRPTEPALFRPSQPGRPQPFAHVRAGFGLSGFADQVVAVGARSKRFGLLAQALCFLGKTFFKRLALIEPASLRHGGPPLQLAIFSHPVTLEPEAGSRLYKSAHGQKIDPTVASLMVRKQASMRACVASRASTILRPGRPRAATMRSHVRLLFTVESGAVA